MPDSTHRDDTPARRRLIAEAARLLAAEGVGGVTARALAAGSGLSLSAANYYFGGRDGLLAACFGEACDEARQAREGWLGELPSTLPPEALLGWLCALALEPPHGGDHPSTLLRELKLAAVREDGLRPLAHSDTEDELRFWRAALPRLGRPEAEAPLFAHFVSGVWGGHARPQLDAGERAWIFETCRRLLGRLDRQDAARPGWDGWRQARLTASQEASVVQAASEARARLQEACVVVVGRNGLAGLTHRAVAAEAQASLAAVTRQFPTRSELVRGTFAYLHARVQARGRARQAPAERVRAETLAAEIAAAIFDETGAPEAEVIALEELIAYAQRHAELQPAADFLRASRGEGSATALARLETARAGLDGLDAYLLSTILQGAMRASYAQPPAQRRAWLERQAGLALSRLFA